MQRKTNKPAKWRVEYSWKNAPFRNTKSVLGRRLHAYRICIVLRYACIGPVLRNAVHDSVICQPGCARSVIPFQTTIVMCCDVAHFVRMTQVNRVSDLMHQSHQEIVTIEARS